MWVPLPRGPPGETQDMKSKWISLLWKSESQEVRDDYKHRAKVLQDEQLRLNPGYKYKPGERKREAEEKRQKKAEEKRINKMIQEKIKAAIQAEREAKAALKAAAKDAKPGRGRRNGNAKASMEVHASSSSPSSALPVAVMPLASQYATEAPETGFTQASYGVPGPSNLTSTTSAANQEVFTHPTHSEQLAQSSYAPQPQVFSDDSYDYSRSTMHQQASGTGTSSSHPVNFDQSNPAQAGWMVAQSATAAIAQVSHLNYTSNVLPMLTRFLSLARERSEI